ncbi:MAG: hypothetical protein WCF67_02815, partial [Chitinophagaceae bacterium]
NNISLDIFIGLIFIFLLYSLLATILMELISHFMSMRARMLVKTLRRMLEDNPPEIFGPKRGWTLFDLWTDTKQSVYRFFYPFKDLSLLRRFYSHPSVKYLGESKSSSKPSYITPANFSQTMIQILRGDNFSGEISQIEAIRKFLFDDAEFFLREYRRMLAQSAIIPHLQEIKNTLSDPSITKEDIAATIDDLSTIPMKKRPKAKFKNAETQLDDLIKDLKAMLDASADANAFIEKFEVQHGWVLKVFHNRIAKDTLEHLQRLFHESHSDIDRFRQCLEIWFGETMNRSTGWYKRQTQWVLLILGFFMAWWGNVDTIKIYKTLAKDKTAREQLVNLTVQSNEKYGAIIQQIIPKTGVDSVVTDTATKQTVVYKTRLIAPTDTALSEARKTVMNDIKDVESILGLGWCSTDSCKKCYEYERLIDSVKSIDADKMITGNNATAKKQRESIETANEKVIEQLETKCEECFEKFENKRNKWSLLGWIITALAISLGAPFWFDMLNKVMRLRLTGNKPASTEPISSAATNTTTASRTPIERKG